MESLNVVQSREVEGQQREEGSEHVSKFIEERTEPRDDSAQETYGEVIEDRQTQTRSDQNSLEGIAEQMDELLKEQNEELDYAAGGEHKERKEADEGLGEVKEI